MTTEKESTLKNRLITGVVVVGILAVLVTTGVILEPTFLEAFRVTVMTLFGA